MSQHISVATADRITTLRFQRPEKKNALTLEMYAALGAALAAARDDSSVRAIVLTGGRECFTSGNDVGDFMRASQGGGGDITAPLAFLRTIAELDKPLVAAVGGVAIGIGTTMLLHCDLVFAAPNARFRTPFVDLGLVPEAASSLLLPELVGARRAAQMLLLGEEVDAPTAHAWGLVNAVADDADAAARLAAAHLASRAPAALRTTKQLMRRHLRDAVRDTMAVEGQAFAERLRSPEAIEAFQAFMTRRSPDFSKF